MLTSQFDFEYPKDQIAFRPAPRGESRLMVIPRSGTLPADFPLPIDRNGWAFGHTKDLVTILQPEDCLILNETKVFKARLTGLFQKARLTTHVLCVRTHTVTAQEWDTLIEHTGFFKIGDEIVFGEGFTGTFTKFGKNNEATIRFNLSYQALYEALEKYGELPTPTYLRRTPDDQDEENYQSLFAKHPGSIAAPTASFHFSKEMLTALEAKHVNTAKIILHVGIGTFRSVSALQIEDHEMHSEVYTLPADAAALITATRHFGNRVVAVGTTSARTIETRATPAGEVIPGQGETNLFITPGYEWKAVDSLLTNFHFPKSTLFMLVCSMIGIERAQAAYAAAIANGFKLFSYGDAMLIL